MNTNATLIILERLIAGIHPLTGEMLSDDSVWLEDDIRQALEHAYGCVARQSAAPEEAKYIRKNGPLSASRPWTQEDDAQLLDLNAQGLSAEEIAKQTMRRRRGVENRLSALTGTTDGNAPHQNRGKPWYP